MEKKSTPPPGKTKIINAMRTLLEDRNFSTITISEIATTAGVTEGLIYKYFKDKRQLLHHVLEEYYAYFLDQIDRDLKGVSGALNKLAKVIWSSIDGYATHRVFARIILLEVRNSDEYFQSDVYGLVRQFNKILLDIIHEGIETGEIRQDISTSLIRHTIFGAIEHACLNRVLFNEAISTDETAEQITHLILNGIKP
ncbi:transcriptional regulator, TetR family [Desulfocicer vacuolatum DSM 3385]|uniref:Transcriptional regulator, TetR family n=1 Tax=Desulfocicer vacuolatum DSM 3385 TaxID=1121400 RepID=A0A1W2EF56_9BACT|nr:TetR/AcrR family transcriptional regulator [Desulfocicer vacuolatum]SMD08361.1 transcriptional regulator, TetR family [Desulfocicer vacuolatum DSM 3385]